MIILEKYTEKDFELYSELVFNEQVMNMNMGRVFTKEEADFFYKAILDLNANSSCLGYYKVFYDKKGTHVYLGMGGISFNDEYRTAEVEYMILPQYWNQGYGKQLLSELLHRCQQSGYTKAIAITDPENTYSRRLLTGASFSIDKEYINDDGEPAIVYIKKLS